MKRNRPNIKLTQKSTEVLIALKDCLTSSKAGLAKVLGIPRTTAGYHVEILKEKSLVVGYIPIVPSGFFGESYLIQITIDPKIYQVKKDVEDTIIAHREYLQKGIGHAPLCVFVKKKDDLYLISCITMTFSIDSFIDELCYSQSIAEEYVTHSPLDDADGIPLYSRQSFAKEENE